jgi:hypothetical protein
MADAVWEELRGLFGKRIDSPEVEAFLARYPEHKVERPSDGRQYVVARKHGFELLFGLPDGSYSGGHTAHLRVLITVFLNSDAVPKSKPFASLPLGLSFADGHEQLVAKLGPPESSKAWDSGEVHSARWRVGDLLLGAAYVRGEGRVKTFTLMPPPVVPA